MNPNTTINTSATTNESKPARERSAVRVPSVLKTSAHYILIAGELTRVSDSEYRAHLQRERVTVGLIRMEAQS